MSELQETTWSVAERDQMQLMIYVQLSRIYDVLLFTNKSATGINDLIEAHRTGALFGPEPALAPED